MQYHLASMPPTTPATPEPPILAALGDAGYRLTAPRRTVATLIADRGGHFTAADLVADARARRMGIGRATIFRAVDLFVDMGLLERIDLPSGEHAYVRCQVEHHHHLVCSACGRSTDVEDEGLAAVVDGIAGGTGWSIDDHRLELYGRCPSCVRNQATQA